MALIFLLSSRSSFPQPPLAFVGDDKIAHILLFGALGTFVAKARLPFEAASWRRFWLVTLLVAAYGVSDELHQLTVPGREFSCGDIAADAAGGALAAFAVRARTIYQSLDPGDRRTWLRRCFSRAE